MNPAEAQENLMQLKDAERFPNGVTYTRMHFVTKLAAPGDKDLERRAKKEGAVNTFHNNGCFTAMFVDEDVAKTFGKSL